MAPSRRCRPQPQPHPETRERWMKTGYLADPRKQGPENDSYRNHKRFPSGSSPIKIEMGVIKSIQHFYIRKDLEIERHIQDFYNRPSSSSDVRLRFEDLFVGGYYVGLWTLPKELDEEGQKIWVRIFVFSKFIDESDPSNTGVFCYVIDYGGLHYFATQNIRPMMRIFAATPWCAARGKLDSMDRGNNRNFTTQDFLETCKNARKYKKGLKAKIIFTPLKTASELFNEPFEVLHIWILTDDINSSFLENIYPEKTLEENRKKFEAGRIEYLKRKEKFDRALTLSKAESLPLPCPEEIWETSHIQEFHKAIKASIQYGLGNNEKENY